MGRPQYSVASEGRRKSGSEFHFSPQDGTPLLGGDSDPSRRDVIGFSEIRKIEGDSADVKPASEGNEQTTTDSSI